MQISEAHRGYLLFRYIAALVLVPIVFIALLVLFLVLGTPWYIPVGLIVIFVFSMLLITFSVVRLLRLNLEQKQLPTSPSMEKAYSDEQVVGAVYGIMAPFRHTTTPGVIGYGEMSHSENSLMFTNKRLLVVMVPVEGAGLAMGGIDYSTAHHLLNKDGIAQKGQQMVATMTPTQILQFDQNNFDIHYSEIKKVKLRSFWNRGVAIWTRDGKKVSYTTSNAQHIDMMRDLFNQYAPGTLG